MYMQTTIISSSQRKYAVPALLLGTAFFISTACSAHAMVSPDQFTQMENQLKFASTQLDGIRASRPAGLVLGAASSTVEVPVRPVCRVSLDKKSYVLGDTIQFSWKTTGGSKVELVNDTSGKDTLVLPEGSLSVGNGSVSIPASVLGNPIVTLKVTSKTGHEATCARVIPIVGSDASQKDTRLAPLNAQVIQMGNQIAKLLSDRENIDKKITTIQTKIDELQVKIAKITAGGTGSTTKTNATFALTSSNETLVVNSDATTSDDYGKFDLKFTLTAEGDDVIVPTKAIKFGSTSEGVLYQVINMATGKPVDKGTFTASLFSSAERVGTTFVVKEGETEEFTVAVIYDPVVTGSYKVQLNSLVVKTTGPKFAFKPAADFSSDALLITN